MLWVFDLADHGATLSFWKGSLIVIPWLANFVLWFGVPFLGLGFHKVAMATGVLAILLTIWIPFYDRWQDCLTSPVSCAWPSSIIMLFVGGIIGALLPARPTATVHNSVLSEENSGPHVPN
jgi:hypothetical protein